MVGDRLAVITVVEDTSCPISVWLAPPQARRTTVTRRIVNLVAGLKKFDFIARYLAFCAINALKPRLDHPLHFRSTC